MEEPKIEMVGKALTRLVTAKRILYVISSPFWGEKSWMLASLSARHSREGLLAADRRECRFRVTVNNAHTTWA